MAEISDYTYAIANARYGEQVRGSIVSALNAMNNELTTSSAGAVQAADRAEQAASNAEIIESRFDDKYDDLDAFLTVAEANEQQRQTNEENRQNVETGYIAQAKGYADQAAAYASSDYAKSAKSWAEGGTSSRYEEDTNNAKYWAQKAKEEADRSAASIAGVATFNGRSGSVVPQSGDYPASMIPYGSGSVESTIGSLETAAGNSIVSIAKSGTSFVATKNDGTTQTFSQENASTSAAGLMSAADKTKFDKITTTNVTAPLAAKTQTVNFGTVSAGRTKSLTVDLTPPDNPSGVTGNPWIPVALRGFSTTASGAIITDVSYPSNTTMFVAVRNVSSSDLTISFSLGVLFYRVIRLGSES